MTVHIHYDGATYTEANHDLDDTLTRIKLLLEGGGGFLTVETVTGAAYLYVSTSVPVAVVDEIESARPKLPGRIY